ncbi:MAG: ATP synthase F1 subunit epsilon [Holophaga sp.]|nr:ATP synthase F1 subunit epsilon [Holophaga sp.]
MTDSILLEVLTPERQIFSAEVAELQFPTAEAGYYGILPGHTPLITPVGDGLVSFTQDDGKHWLTVFGGFAEVGPDHVTILARVSETVDMIDVERAEAARLRSLQLLKEAQTEPDLDTAQIHLRASLIRLAAAGHAGGHGY